MARSAQRLRCFVSLPKFTAAPTITGTAQNGQTLTGSPGTIRDGAVSARQWKRNGAAIAGATGATYTLQGADVGAVITFEVTATANLRPSNTAKATSAPTATVLA